MIYCRRDGQLVYIEFIAQVVRDRAGQVVNYVTVNRDITERKQAEQVRQRQTERLQILNEISQGMLGVQSPQAIAQIALPRLRRLIPCQRASLTLLDFETHELVVVAVHAEYESETRLGLRQPLNPNFVAQLQKGPMVLMDDLRSLAESPVAKTLLAEGLRALLLAPLRVQEALIGSLNLGADQPNIFTEEHVAIAREVADLLAVAIQHAHLYEQVSAGRSRLEALSHQLLEAQETERRRLAYELHDEIGQMLTAVKLNLQVLQRQPQQPAQPVADSINLVEQAIQQVRHLSLNLHPSLLDDLGLVATLRWFLDGQRQRTNLKINLRVEPAEMQLPPHLNTVCFRVAQEALTNVIRHAQAQQVWVELAAQGSELSLIIHDDGIGFAVEESLKRASQGASLGLIGMQERVSLAAGRLEINSEPGRGCEIRAYFPLGQ
ncbi:MAG: histidine kinase [Anaerolineae bacterium]